MYIVSMHLSEFNEMNWLCSSGFLTQHSILCVAIAMKWTMFLLQCNAANNKNNPGRVYNALFMIIIFILPSKDIAYLV